jgi:hypothetical protein
MTAPDFDKSGTTQRAQLVNLGPSVGWARTAQNLQQITAPGTYVLDPSTTLVTVNVAGAVTITLPSAVNPSYRGAALTQPGLFAKGPITIVDVGGNAAANPITIQAFGSEQIIGLASIQLNVKFGGYTLLPNSAGGNWNAVAR